MSTADPYDRVIPLIEQLFEAPASRSGWERALAALSQEMSGDAMALLVARTTTDGPAFVIGPGMESRFLRPADVPLTPDPETMARLPPVGQMFETPPASAPFAATALFRNVLAPLGLPPGPALGVVLARDEKRMLGALMVMWREPSWKPSDDDRELLTLLAPYLAQAASQGFQLTESGTGVTALLDILDALALGVVLLDSSGNLSFANESAAAQLGLPAGLAAPGSIKGRMAEKVREALRNLGRPPDEEGRGFHVVAAPLDPVGAELGANARFATALFISDRVKAEAGAKRFAELYGLTPAEERLALKLGAGATLAEAAEQLGVKVATARGVLRSVFKKTGTHRQAELVSLVLTGVGQIRPNPPGGS